MGYYDGRVVRGTPAFPAGKYGNAFTAAGAIYAFPNLPQSIRTVECWLKTSIPNNTSAFLALANTYGLPGQTLDFWMGLNTGKAYATHFRNSLGITGTTTIIDGLWHHVALTLDAGTARLWVDGVQEGSVASSQPSLVASDSQRWNIGGWDEGALYDWPGQIDGIRFSDVARYSTPFTPPAGPFVADANTVALFQLDADATDSATPPVNSVGPRWPTPVQISGGNYVLGSAPSQAASNTKLSIPAATTATYKFRPEVTHSTTGGVSGTYVNQGWQIPGLVGSDPGVILAGSVLFTAKINLSGQLNPTLGCALYGYLWVGNTILGSVVIPGVPATVGTRSAAGTISWPDTVIPAGAALSLEVYFGVPTVNTSITATVVTLLYTSVGTALGGGIRYTKNSARNVIETLTLSESATRQATLSRTAVEAIPTTESPTRAAIFRRANSETATTTDTVSRTAMFPRSTVETLFTTDAPTRQAILSRATVETLLTTDTPTRQATLSRSTVETLLTTDTPSRRTTLSRSTVETLLTTDTPTRRASLSRAAVETLLTTDSATRQVAYSRKVTEALSGGGSIIIVRPNIMFDD